MIPDAPDLTFAFGSLSLGDYTHLPDDEKVVVCQPVLRHDPARRTETESPRLGLGFHRATKVRLDSLVKRVEAALVSKRHAICGVGPQSRGIAAKILALAVAVSTRADEVRINVNHIIGSISGTSVSLFAILPFRALESHVYHFGDFSFGRLNAERLEHVCSHAGSDYFDRYSKSLTNCAAASRELSEVGVFSFSGSPFDVGLLTSEQDAFVGRILDYYFADVAEGLWDQFRSDMVRQQAVGVAAGIGEVSTDVFWQLTARTDFVAVYTWKDPNGGWVVPNQSCPTLQWVSPKALARTNAEISANLRLNDWGSRGLDGVVQTFSEYLQAATHHKSPNRSEEALLHTVFGLDLLLGGKATDALTKVLSERVGFLAAIPLNRICLTPSTLCERLTT